MKAPLDRDDIALMVSRDIATWTKVRTEAEALARLHALADRICDYAYLHYSTPAILTGLPGS